MTLFEVIVANGYLNGLYGILGTDQIIRMYVFLNVCVYVSLLWFMCFVSTEGLFNFVDVFNIPLSYPYMFSVGKYKYTV